MTAVLDATPFAVALGYGFLFGLRHAFDPDHLVAMGTIVGESRSFGRSAIVGAMWGIGHTVALLAAGVVVLTLRLSIPDRLALSFEMGVAVMLVALGTILVARAARGEVHVHAHSHKDGTVHAHLHAHAGDCAGSGEPKMHEHPHGFRGFLASLAFGRGSRMGEIGRKPFLVGMVHGLAGSAGLMILGLAATKTVLGGLAYLLLFGVGLIVAMLGMGAFLSVPFVLTSSPCRRSRFNTAFRIAAGLASIAFGLFLGYEIGFVDGLFLGS
jgi:high-affinity nickel-transport protein